MKWLRRILYFILILSLFCVFAYNDGIQFVLSRIVFSTGPVYFDGGKFAIEPNCDGVFPCESGAIKVLTFNVLCRMCEKEGYESWDARLPHMKEMLLRYDADLLGLQELMDAQDVLTMQNMIGGVETFGAVTFALGNWQYPDCALLYRKARFELLDSGQMWLSPKPTLPLAKGWKPLSVPRYINWAYLRQKDNGFRFLFINTHFDNNGVNKEASAFLFSEIYGKLDENIPMIVTGDFNTPRDADRFNNLQGMQNGEVIFHSVEDAAKKRSIAGELRKGVEARSGDYLKISTLEETEKLIDHIFYGGPVQVEVNNWILDLAFYGDAAMPISDHPLVYGEVEMRIEKQE